MTICNISVSIGELWDKYTILLIKLNKISDENKLSFINTEINLLKNHLETYKLNGDIFDELKNCNEKLWNIEDKLREKEKKKEFDQEFIEIARLVYFTNDNRASIKKKINTVLNSTIHEIKSYEDY
mgnify:FL=1